MSCRSQQTMKISLPYYLLPITHFQDRCHLLLLVPGEKFAFHNRRSEGIMLRQNANTRLRLTRRHLLGIFLASITGAVGAGCATESMEKNISMNTDKRKNQDRQASMNGRLLARPTQPTGTASVGLQPLGLSTKRDGLLYVPKNYQASRPAPLVVMLHGAGGDARGGLTPFRNLADATGLICWHLPRAARPGMGWWVGTAPISP